MNSRFDISGIESLAPMPRSLDYLAKLQYAPDIWVGEVARVIDLDEALTANLLRWANSAWSHSSTSVGNVKDALIRMGIANVLNLVLITALASPMRRACPAYQLAENELSQHSILAYVTATCLGQFAAQPIPDTVATASLIHDLGKLLIERYLSRELMLQMSLAVKSGKVSPMEAELQYLGTDHAEVGMQIARHWKFPDDIAQTIRRHHDPEPPRNTLLDAVQVCDMMAKQIFRKDPQAEPLWEAMPGNLQRLGIEPADMALLSIRVEDEVNKINFLF